MDKQRILLIDDEAAFTRVLKSYLEKTGRYEVRMENSGTDAAEIARAFRPDLILLDIIMPDVDGARVAEAIKDDVRLQHIPVVFLTAVASRDEVYAHGGMIGGQCFLAKPVSAKDVLARIELELGAVQKGEQPGA